MGTGGLDNNVKVAYHEYDFARDGGAIGEITLRGNDIPKDAIVIDGMIDVETAITSDGSATAALKLVGAADLKTATAKATYAVGAILDIVPVGTGATSIRATSHSKPIMTVAVAALTAGKLTIATRYILPRD